MPSDIPPLLRAISNMLILLGVLGLVLSLIGFASLPWWAASIGMFHALAQLVCYVGLRGMRRWSVTLFFTCVGIGAVLVAATGIREFAASSQRVAFMLLPIVLYVVAWYPHRDEFS